MSTRSEDGATLVVCPAIKSWKPKLEQQLLTVLADLVAAEGDEELVLDICAGAEGPEIAKRTKGLEVVLKRRTPSSRPLERGLRAMGVYSGKSTLALAVRVHDGAELKRLLSGDVLWGSEFALYPRPTVELVKMPDPLSEAAGFDKHVKWCLRQEVGVDGWSINGRDSAKVKEIVGIVNEAIARQRL